MRLSMIALAAMMITPALGDDAELKTMFSNGVDHVVLLDGSPTAAGDDPSSEPLPALNVGDVCTDDPRCADEPGVAAGTGRLEKQYHLGYLQVPGANPDVYYGPVIVPGQPHIGFDGNVPDDYGTPADPVDAP